MKKLNTTISTGQPPSQSLELLQALGIGMGEIRTQVRFKEVVLRGYYIEQQLKLMEKVLYIELEKPSCILCLCCDS